MASKILPKAAEEKGEQPLLVGHSIAFHCTHPWLRYAIVIVMDNPTVIQLLQQILKVLQEIRDEMANRR
jgi:hypothetical protein